MKRPMTLALLLALGGAAYGQISTTVCDIVKQPSAFDGKLVRVWAMRIRDLELSAISDPELKCSELIWLDYPWTLKKRRSPAERARDEDFNRFETLSGRVAGTMTGLVNYAEHGFGFGHMNRFPIRFVLQSVPDVVVLEGSLTGQVIGPDGKAITHAEVKAEERGRRSLDTYFLISCTDEEGRFKLAVPPGSYLVGVNLLSPPSPAAPFPATYFPGTPEVDSAQVVSIRDKEHRDLTIRLGNPLTQRVIPVKVVWPNGSPAANVELWTGEGSDSTLNWGPNQGRTNSTGVFDLIVFGESEHFVFAQIERHKKDYCATLMIPGTGELKERVLVRLASSQVVCRKQFFDHLFTTSFHDSCRV
jgi:hypothetical protein